ncbi:DNA methyltransferase [Paracoccus sp. CPCC 101403]|uniref:Methyltransferase n=1 Tax=Paracoccus broussonetiae TaxID=3075834 RepID=A0ABU3EJU2_9RHOB|nr:DNA methyltransferase [Paracoccus sp. CPCC 101403]MDT1064375.1 DNA methyltransferase [Paracoccus sp. CPCC 101403]
MNQLSFFDEPPAATLDAPLSERAVEDFIENVAEFDQFGTKTARDIIDEIPYFVNEFWTAGQRQAHSIHEISYRACFKAQLPQFFIERLTRPGDVVHDPFMGRGTTPVQAALMGRQAFGNDINPLSVLLTRPRLAPVDQGAVDKALRSVDYNSGKIRRDDLKAFYHPETLAGLEALRDWIDVHAPIGDHTPDPVADWIRMVSINRLSGHSPGFFSGRSMPPNQAVSVKAQLKINEKLGVTPPPRDIAAVVSKKTRTLLKDGQAPSQVRHSLHVGSAWDTPGIAERSVDLVVTSPPFLDIVQYALDNWLRCWFAGIDPETVKIAMHRTEESWTEMVHNVLAEQARIVRSGGHVAFEVGEVRNGKVLLEKLVWRATEGLPFERLGVLVNDQEFTKTANCWGVNNGSKGTNTNRIVVLRRH